MKICPENAPLRVVNISHGLSRPVGDDSTTIYSTFVIKFDSQKNQDLMVRAFSRSERCSTHNGREDGAPRLGPQHGTEEVRQLLAEGSDVAERGGSSLSTPLGAASWRGREGVVGLLLEAGADMSATDIYRWMPLVCATRWGREAVVRLLLDRGGGQRWKDPSIVGLGRCDRISATSDRSDEALRRAKCLAFAMGQQERLGAGSSRVHELDEGVVRMVLEQV
jgi:hypothetical protein